MTADLVWLMIIANGIIALLNIANNWALARYGKKKVKKLISGPPKVSLKKRRRDIKVQAILICIFSTFGVIAAIMARAPSNAIQALWIAMFVGFIVLAIAVFLMLPLMEVLERHIELTGLLLEKDMTNTDEQQKTTEENKPC